MNSEDGTDGVECAFNGENVNTENCEPNANFLDCAYCADCRDDSYAAKNLNYENRTDTVAHAGSVSGGDGKSREQAVDNSYLATGVSGVHEAD